MIPRERIGIIEIRDEGKWEPQALEDQSQTPVLESDDDLETANRVMGNR